MHPNKFAFTLILAGSTALAGFAFAEVTAPMAPPQSNVVKLDDSTDYSQHLRDARKLLNDAKAAFEKDPADKADHRKEILDGIDKAITAIDAEVDEYKADGAK